MGAGLARLLGWSWQAGLVFGLALSVASTVVMVRAFQDRHMLDTERGRIAVGWLVVEDLVDGPGAGAAADRGAWWPRTTPCRSAAWSSSC